MCRLAKRVWNGDKLTLLTANTIHHHRHHHLHHHHQPFSFLVLVVKYTSKFKCKETVVLALLTFSCSLSNVPYHVQYSTHHHTAFKLAQILKSSALIVDNRPQLCRI